MDILNLFNGQEDCDICFDPSCETKCDKIDKCLSKCGINYDKLDNMYQFYNKNDYLLALNNLNNVCDFNKNDALCIISLDPINDCCGEDCDDSTVELARKLYYALTKDNNNNYQITHCGRNVERAWAENDDEAKSYFNRFLEELKVSKNEELMQENILNYNGYDIEYNFYGDGEYTVNYNGDDLWFETLKEAKDFIDSITNESFNTDDKEQEILTEGGKYSVRGYYQSSFRGLSDSDDFDELDVALDYVWDLVQNGLYVTLENSETGEVRLFSPDELEHCSDPCSIEDCEITNESIVEEVKSKYYLVNKIVSAFYNQFIEPKDNDAFEKAINELDGIVDLSNDEKKYCLDSFKKMKKVLNKFSIDELNNIADKFNNKYDVIDNWDNDTLPIKSQRNESIYESTDSTNDFKVGDIVKVIKGKVGVGEVGKIISIKSTGITGFSAKLDIGVETNTKNVEIAEQGEIKLYEKKKKMFKFLPGDVGETIIFNAKIIEELPNWVYNLIADVNGKEAHVIANANEPINIDNPSDYNEYSGTISKLDDDIIPKITTVKDFKVHAQNKDDYTQSLFDDPKFKSNGDLLIDIPVTVNHVPEKDYHTRSGKGIYRYYRFIADDGKVYCGYVQRDKYYPYSDGSRVYLTCRPIEIRPTIPQTIVFDDIIIRPARSRRGVLGDIVPNVSDDPSNWSMREDLDDGISREKESGYGSRTYVSQHDPDSIGKFKVGDYIKVVKGGAHKLREYPLGSIHKVVGIENKVKGYNVYLRYAVLDDGGQIDASYCVKATESEIAEYTRQRDEIKKNDKSVVLGKVGDTIKFNAKAEVVGGYRPKYGYGEYITKYKLTTKDGNVIIAYSPRELNTEDFVDYSATVTEVDEYSTPKITIVTKLTPAVAPEYDEDEPRPYRGTPGSSIVFDAKAKALPDRNLRNNYRNIPNYAYYFITDDDEYLIGWIPNRRDLDGKRVHAKATISEKGIDKRSEIPATIIKDVNILRFSMGESYEFVKSKSVVDSDGFITDYSMYKNNSGDSDEPAYVFVYGDKELYLPEDGYYDWECDSEEEANEWFDNFDLDTELEGDDYSNYNESLTRLRGIKESFADKYYQRQIYNDGVVSKLPLKEPVPTIPYQHAARWNELSELHKRMKRDFKEQDKIVDEFIKLNMKRDNNPNIKYLAPNIDAYKKMHLAESNKKLRHKKSMNEGPGAGYILSGKINPVSVNNFKMYKHGDTIEAKVDFDITINDFGFYSYYYGDTLDSVGAKITKIVFGDDTEYPVDNEQDLIDLVDGIDFNVVYGGGWSHSTFGGKIVLHERDINYFSPIDIYEIVIEIPDVEVIDYVDQSVTGDT